jgi:hypothetical protein
MYKLQQWTAADMRGAFDMMGFDNMVKRNTSYIYPFYTETRTRNIVLYGAGNVGQNYCKQLRFRRDVNIALWVDKEYERYSIYGVRPVDEILGCIYDYVIIAVKNAIPATEIRLELLKKGISTEKILWREPEILVV